MDQSCEVIITENEKLKLSDLDKSCLNIYEYLKLHHGIANLVIDIKKNDANETLFFSCNISGNFLINKLEFRQNCDTNIIFCFLSNTQEDFESVKINLSYINICLQIFSTDYFF